MSRFPAADLLQRRQPGLEPGPDGEFVGRDPRVMSIADLTALGHTATSPLKALRARCLDCCGDNASEVRKCVATDCPAWPFRMGKNPWRALPSDKRRAVSREVAARINASRPNGLNARAETATPTSPGIPLPGRQPRAKITVSEGGLS